MNKLHWRNTSTSESKQRFTIGLKNQLYKILKKMVKYQRPFRFWKKAKR